MDLLRDAHDSCALLAAGRTCRERTGKMGIQSRQALCTAWTALRVVSTMRRCACCLTSSDWTIASATSWYVWSASAAPAGR